MRVIGLDPGLRRTGWGVIDSEGTRLRHVANGVVESDGNLDLARRLVQLDKGLLEVLHEYRPEEAAVEASLVNKNAGSTLKLGVARGVVLLTPAKHGLPVAEYLPMIVKKAVVGTGHASKEQVQGCAIANPDAADALAVAICHSHHAATERRWFAGSEGPLLGAQGDRR
jgi:crossover junction endodeoxyribonuclease RuvC